MLRKCGQFLSPISKAEGGINIRKAGNSKGRIKVIGNEKNDNNNRENG